jgi:hypothetical protein
VANARGLAFDGERLWIGDGRAGTITAVDAKKGERLKSIRLGEGTLAPCQSIEDLAWDGKNLWVACYGGSAAA